jgi:hypothetical protein
MIPPPSRPHFSFDKSRESYYGFFNTGNQGDFNVTGRYINRQIIAIEGIIIGPAYRGLSGG